MIRLEDADGPEESLLREQVARIYRAAQEDAKPYIDRLVALAAMKTPSYLLTPEEYEAMILVRPAPPSAEPL